MATIRCWALHGNINNAINYVINPNKTDNGMLVESTSQRPEISGYCWKAQEKIRPEYEGDFTDIVGYHFQQSFEAGSITPDEALEISKEWIEKITGGQHDYVLAVHIDQADRKKNPHIHTHIIINPRNKVTDKKMQIFYKKDIPTFKEISDRICVEHGKKVLREPKGQGKTYYEWMLENQGDSLKEVISKTIDTVIPKVKDYDEFKMYLTKLGYEIEDGLNNQPDPDIFEFTADISLFNDKLSTENNYYIRIPSTNDYISVPKKKGRWLQNDVTYSLKFGLDERLVRYDSDGLPKAEITGEDLRSYFEDKTRESIGRKGLRIKVPHSKKFIRCQNIKSNEDGDGYSLNEVIERIENNGRYASDPEVLKLIGSDQVTKDSLNRFYEEANIRTKWMNSKYYKMSKKERYIDFKTNEIQNRLNEIHERRKGADDILVIDELKKNRSALQNDLREINTELSKQEAYYEQIQMDRLADLLEASEKEIEEYAVINIVPLQETRRKLKDEISSLSLRINRAENKVRKANEKVHTK